MLENFNGHDHFPEMYLKEMDQKTGILMHLYMAYPLIMPFLRGLYLNMNYWRPKRDRDGWKLSKRAYDSFINAGRRQDHIGYSSGYREEDRAPNLEASQKMYPTSKIAAPQISIRSGSYSLNNSDKADNCLNNRPTTFTILSALSSSLWPLE